MSNTSTFSQKEPLSNHTHSQAVVWDMKAGSKPDRPDFYELTMNTIGFPILLWASLSSPNLSLYNVGMPWKREHATTISAGIDFQENIPNKKRISAKEAGRLVMLDLERAEARRRQYAEELARFQMERLELGD